MDLRPLAPHRRPAPPRPAFHDWLHQPSSRRLRRRQVLQGLVGMAGFSAAGWVFSPAPIGFDCPSLPDGCPDLSRGRPLGEVRSAEPNVIQIENSSLGTTDFAFPFEPAVMDRIHGYASTDSAVAGEEVTLFVSTAADSFSLELFRFGYYGGAGARRVASFGPVPGVLQGPPVVDSATGMRECAWEPSQRITVDRSWTPGMYLFRLLSDDGGGTFIPLVVRDERRAELLVISAVTTWQAYNRWGGSSLYFGPDGRRDTRSRVVSFDRPYDTSGSGHFFGGEYELVQQVESMGIDVAYTTNVALHADPAQTTSHGYKAVVSLGHDEYYSVEMRDALESARDAGVNLMFLGANAVFRRIRLEPSNNGRLRRQVNYRDPAADPASRSGPPAEVTAEWRRAPAARPESTLIGNLYESNPCFGDMVVADAASWVFAGTDLRDGDALPGVVGDEYDRVTPEQPTPGNIQVLCHSPLVVLGRPTFADMTYYTHEGDGAGVWATGTLWWEYHLGALCPEAGGRHSLECHLRRITANVLEVFLQGPAGRVQPSVPNLARFGIRPGYVVDPPPG